MSMLAVFNLGCCKRQMVFGRFRGHVENPVSIKCPGCGKKVDLSFSHYASEQKLGIKENGKWNALQVLLPK